VTIKKEARGMGKKLATETELDDIDLLVSKLGQACFCANNSREKANNIVLTVGQAKRCAAILKRVFDL
jgi:hypothetical protein